MSREQATMISSWLAVSCAKLQRMTTAFVVQCLFLAGLPAYGGEVVADFALVDVNPTSSTYNQPVSPRDFLQKVSGWYFGHAT